MFIAKTLSFYKRRDVQAAMVEQAHGKEVSVKYQDYFGKRPEALYNEGDVLDFAKRKATSFHCSEELWQDPLAIQTGMSRKEIAELRTGWDLILDIDCPYWPLAKLITHMFIKALEAHDIKSVTCKFSGGKGFHIAIPFEAFPETFQGQETKDLFPEAPRRIAYYLLDYLAKHYVEEREDQFLFDGKYKISKQQLARALGKEVKDFTTARADEEKMTIYLLCRNCGHAMKTSEEKDTYLCPACNGLMQQEQAARQKPVRPQFDPLTIIEVDTILIAHRHLYRLPYSFHEKSELVSVPVHKDEVLMFRKERARPQNVDFNVPFLKRDATRGEANRLLLAAYDYDPQLPEEEQAKKEYQVPEEALPEECFPPCIQAMLAGLKDGRKRAMFTLINFLRGCGWSHEQIEEKLDEWNARNEEQLRQVELKGRLRYEKTKKEAAPPHNCKRYYQDFGVCKPDEFCNRIRNPLQYAKLKAEMGGHGKPKRGKLTEEQKAARRKHRERKRQATTPSTD